MLSKKLFSKNFGVWIFSNFLLAFVILLRNRFFVSCLKFLRFLGGNFVYLLVEWSWLKCVLFLLINHWFGLRSRS